MDLRIGTKTSEICTAAKTLKVDKSIKDKIFEFCTYDIDKEVTDSLELHILKEWFSGKSEIKMPKLSKTSSFGDFMNVIGLLFGIDCNSVQTSDNMIKVMTSKKDFFELNIHSTTSTLVDGNTDGIADHYTSTIIEPNAERATSINL